MIMTMKVARTLKFYGFMVFRACVADHPEPHTRVTVAIGKSSLNLRIAPASPDGETHEVILRSRQTECALFLNLFYSQVSK